MSGTQGRFPPAMPRQAPQQAWREGEQAPTQQQHPHAQQPHAQHPQAQQAHPAWPPMLPANPQQQPGQAPTFPPRFAPPPGAAPADASAAQAAWTPAPPAPFPPQPQQAAPRVPVPPSPPPQQAQQPQAYSFAPHQPLEQPRRPPDLSAYDLGSYGLPTQHAPQQVPPGHRDPRTAPPTRPQHAPIPPAQQQWPPQPTADPFAYPAAPHAPHTAQTPQQPHLPAYQPAGYPGAHGHAAQPSHVQQQPTDQDLEIEDEPPRKRRRWMIAAALAGSIAVGSGLAYAYKSFLGPRSKDEVPTARAPTGPTKVAPSDRGGTRIPNQDSQLLNARVPAQGGTAAGGMDTAGSGFTDSNGVRRVPTVAVGPGGAAAPAPEAPRPPPGMTIVGGGAAGSPTLIGAPPASPPPPNQPRIAAAPPATTAAQPPAQPVPPAAPRRVPTQPQPQEPEAGQQQAAVPPRSAAPKRPITGYVAALGYHRTQLDAMKMMADLQQRYEPLRDKKLEIVQSDESTRGLGIIFRVVGPKGSASSARELCAQLKQAGMPDRGCYTLGM